MVKTRLDSNITKMISINILDGMIFFLPVMVLFWQENGLSLTEIMVLESLYAIMVVLLEVPTGYFADTFGRRTSIIIASLFKSFAVFAYSLGSGFYEFLIAEFFWSLGMSFRSGADSALIYDTLISLKKEHEFKKIQGRLLYYNLLSVAFSGIIGAWIAGFGLRLALLATVPAKLISAAISFTLKEPPRKKPIYERGYFLDILSVMKNSLFRNRNLRSLMIFTSVILSISFVSFWLYQPYLSMSGISIGWFGAIYALFSIISAVSSKYAHSIEKRIGLWNSLLLMVIFISSGYMLLGKYVLFIGFIFAFPQQFVFGFSAPVIEDYIHKNTKSDVRATVLSGVSMVNNIAYALIVPFIGYFADTYTLPTTLFGLGVFTLVAGLSILMLFRHRKSI